MSLRAEVLSRMHAALDDFEARHATPFASEARIEIRDLVIAFADDWITASEADDEDLDAAHFDELLDSISYFQDRVSETLAA
jgi:hypothetical protein